MGTENIWLQTFRQTVEGVELKLVRVIEVLPQLSGAVLLFIFGLALAEFVYRAMIALSAKLKLELIAEKVGLTHYLSIRKSTLSSSHVIAKATKAFLIFFFFMEATRIAGFGQVAQFLNELMSYLPDVLIAIFIMLVGLRIGNTVQSLVSTSLHFAHEHTAQALGLAGKYTMLTFAVLAALSQLEIAEILIQTLFIGFVAMLTLAGGLAFGLGGKDVVKQLLEAVKKMGVKRGLKK